MQKIKMQIFLLLAYILVFTCQALAYSQETDTTKHALPRSGDCRRVTTTQASKPPRYLTHIKHVENRDGATMGDEVTIEDTRRHKAVWKHTFRTNPERPGGLVSDYLKSSSNPAAFLFCEAHVARKTREETLRMYVWRAGKGVHIVSLDQEDFCFDYFMEVYGGYYALWSPDARRVLLRTGISGAATIDAGPLWCVDVQTGQMRLVAHAARSATWSGSRRIHYRQVKSEPFALDPKIHTWTWR